MKKGILAALAAAAVFCMTVPVMAETFTSSDGIISIELPNENWKEIQDPAKWVTLSDGGNLFTIDHFSNGEKLPDMEVASNQYVNVFQGVYSTQNEVFILTGSVVDSDKVGEIMQMISTAKILKYDTKTAVKSEASASTAVAGINAAASGSYTVVPMDQTMYVTSDGLNVRAGWSTNDTVIAGLARGNSVKVTGKVQQDGKDIGWYEISVNSGKGYVSSSYLSATAPQTEQAVNNTVFSGDVKTIYEIDGAAITVYKSTDGYWYDKAGTKYTQISDYEFESGGITLTTNKPQSYTSNYPLTNGFTAFWANGNTTNLTPYSDGYYYSSEWVRYSDNGNGSYSGSDGSVLYDYDPYSGNPTDAYESDTVTPSDTSNGEMEMHHLVRVEDGLEVTVSEGGGAFYDDNNTEYSWINSTQMMDYYGHTYNVQW